jgi:hypothetical protein
VHRRAGHREPAEKDLTAARDQLNQGNKQSPKAIEPLRRLAAVHADLARLADLRGNTKEAETLARKAVELLVEARKLSPNSPIDQLRLEEYRKLLPPGPAAR